MIKFTLGNCYTKVECDRTVESIIIDASTIKNSYFIKVIECPKCQKQIPSGFWVKKYLTIRCKNYDCGETYKPLEHIKTVQRMKEFSTMIDNNIPTGLLPQLIKRLKQSNISYNIIDARQIYHPFPIENKVPELRYYQKDAIRDALIKKRGVMHLPVGSGKTIISAKLIFETAIPAVIIVPTLQLLDQTYDKIKEWSTITSIGKIGDNNFEPADITIATAQTLNSRFSTIEVQEFLKSIRTLCVDESHHLAISNDYEANTWYKIAMATPNAYFRFALTATPGAEGTLERQLLEFATGTTIYKVGIEELVKAGYLSQPYVNVYKIPNDYNGEKDWSTIEKRYITENDYRNRVIAEVTKKSSKNQTVLVSVNKINHGKKLESMIEESIFIQGSTDSKERNEVIEKFKKGEIKVVVSTLLKEGTDIPELNVIVNAGGGSGMRDDKGFEKSGRLVIQRAGRALRRTDSKNQGIIIDFIDSNVPLLRKHSRERIKAYEAEGFIINQMGVILI